MYTIYIDVLIILNIYINFFLLRTTAKLTHSPLKISRCIVASAYGSIFSLIILFPAVGIPLSLAFKLIAAVTIVIAAFGTGGKIRLLINIIVFFSVNFIFAGVIYAVYSWLRPEFMHFNNTYFYIDFSLAVLVCTTAALYICVCLIRFAFDRIPAGSGYYKIIIRYRDKIISLCGLADTGNALVDYFTGKPVIICGKDKLTEITGYEAPDTDRFPKGFRLIPCSTVSSDGLIPVFRPDEVIILDGKNGIRKSVEAMIGFGENSQEAIFNPKLLRL